MGRYLWHIPMRYKRVVHPLYKKHEIRYQKDVDGRKGDRYINNQWSIKRIRVVIESCGVRRRLWPVYSITSDFLLLNAPWFSIPYKPRENTENKVELTRSAQSGEINEPGLALHCSRV